jgi:hypothetical protein
MYAFLDTQHFFCVRHIRNLLVLTDSSTVATNGSLEAEQGIQYQIKDGHSLLERHFRLTTVSEMKTAISSSHSPITL